MKQSRLIGKTKGLRPSQLRRLDSIVHRRHPANQIADQLTLERLAEQVIAINQPLHLLLDIRGVCRFLFVGPIHKVDQLMDYLPEKLFAKKNSLRLISCPLKWPRGDSLLDKKEAIVTLDLAPASWLRFSPLLNSRGIRSAALWQPQCCSSNGWRQVEVSDLTTLCSKDLEILLSIDPTTTAAVQFRERVLLLTLQSENNLRSKYSLAELEGLVRSAGAEPVAVVSQKIAIHHNQTIWGKGKLQEAALAVRKNNATLVITDRELNQVQLRNLERLLDCPVTDRSELILDIFAQRASSSSGRLQVELAQLRYRMPRLLGRGRSLSRQGGGIGTRGPGETQLEKDRRSIVRRIDRLKRELEDLRNHRVLLRNRRNLLPRVAFVGYTNVGKSSLLNALCKRDSTALVLAEDKLFATLDPITRCLKLPNPGNSPNKVLITDTVGFIRDLPLPLKEAFRATLEETIEADLLLLLVDLSNPDWLFQLETVNDLLDSLGVTSIRQVVANKIDCCENSAIEMATRLFPTVLFVSATSGAGLQSLKKSLQDQFWGGKSESSQAHD